MGKPSAPAPPDPKATAAASTGTNIGTALANATLGNVNQVTPEGSLTYGQTGSSPWKDPYTGQSYDIPSYTATQTLSPTGQATFNTQQQTKQNLANIGQQQSGMLGSLLGTPVDLSSGATEARTMDLARARLDPLLANRASATEADLLNRGIRPGSDAYDRAHTVLDQGSNDAYNQLILSGHGQAVSDILTQRNTPINEITALMSGSQVAQPNYVSTNMPTIANTDTAGIINAGFGQQEQAYGQKMNTYNDIMGGLFGLGAGALKMSDIRLKRDIRQIGETFDGQPLYFFHYLGDDTPQIGLMAQDVEKVRPEAVVTMANGFKAVDYEKALGAI